MESQNSTRTAKKVKTGITLTIKTLMLTEVNFLSSLKRAPRIELGSIAWKAMVLPLNYARTRFDQSNAILTWLF